MRVYFSGFGRPALVMCHQTILDLTHRATIFLLPSEAVNPKRRLGGSEGNKAKAEAPSVSD